MGRRTRAPACNVATVVAMLVLGLCVSRPATADAAIDIQYTCTPAPADCSGWHHTPVTVTWSINPRPEEGSVIISGCGSQTVASDTAATLVWCEASFGSDVLRRTRMVAVDMTPPSVTGAEPARAADANGWYRQAVTVGFRGADALSGIASCTSTSYAGPDSATAAVLGTCTDTAGNVSAPATFTLPYDATAPSITEAVAARKPDHDGWYTHPVRWTFSATDALSGVDQCPTVLAAPFSSSAAAPFAGSCSDRAGNVASRTFSLAYDAVPPTAPRVQVDARDHAIRLLVSAAADTTRLRISRSPGLRSAKRSTLYTGRPAGFTDRRLANGRRYRYVITAFDQAGTVSRRRVNATPGPRLLSPPGGASVNAPPRFEWTPVRSAGYYNVQLYRGHRKVLSAWPSSAHLQLRAQWSFAGRSHRLQPGRYRWYVWPGRGSRSERRFGPRLGTRSFVVTG